MRNMTRNKKPLTFKVVATLMLSLACSIALAQPFPSRPVKLIVPFTAGGSVDAVGRAVGQGLSEQLGQPVVVDNRPGADGAIGTAEVIRSKPDGHTLLVATNTQILAVPTLRLKPPYDPLTALQPIGLLGQSAFFMYVHPSLPVNNLKEFIAYAKANPGKLSYAFGNSTGNLAAAQLVRLAGLQMTGVPYKGEAPALPDLISGRVQMMLASTTSMLNMVKDGKLKAIASIGDARSALAPDVPTFDEAGLRGITILPWIGLFAPADTSPEIVTRLSRELTTLMRQPANARLLEQQGLTPAVRSPGEMRTFISTQLQIWTRLISEAGVERE
ncbi:MAG: tripartite tricarboxylate transporter substrate binding protein [Polaromonas sp.]|uniref:Bug family tripartite tricarboxylate transporter substrate binding protein n=1 Tax=Polaromonas sp. TaxID=1869339 RepID=UPI0025DC0328|nr:tripartite tricarboxylate transporter substrate binding protein [Polaromonas sp.]MBI2727201.1 tripartite tricarboxylate transporter substrate binding protein [Polaromonas sp.]